MSHPTRVLPRLVLVCGLVAVLATSRAAGASASLLAAPSFTNVQVSHDSFPAHSEPMVAENPRDPNNLIAGSKFFTDPSQYRFKIGTYYTTDGGKSWHDDGILPGYQAYDTVSDISFAYSRSGLAYAAVLGCTPKNCNSLTSSGIFVSRSNDGGKTWDDPASVFVDTSGDALMDKPWITVDQTTGPYKGTVYVAWNLDGPSAEAQDPDAANRPRQTPESPDSGIAVARSTDYGRTFSAPVIVYPFDETHFALGATPVVDPAGNLYIAFWVDHQTVSGPQYSMQFVRSTDGGQTFSAPAKAASGVVTLPSQLPNRTFRTFSLPAFAASPHDGALVLAWADYRNHDADILEVHSTDHGKTWSSPVRVNHDRLRDGKDQFMPALAFAPNGVATCSWFDRRRDPNDALVDEYIAQSRDDGKTFGKNLRVTQKSWDPAIGAPLDHDAQGETFIGDYQGLAVDNNQVHPLWNDTQNGASQQIRTAMLNEQVFRRK